MRNKLLFVFWLIATVGVTYVANTAVGLVDLQMFPNRTRIEVLTLSEPEDVSSDLSISVISAPVENDLNLNSPEDSNDKEVLTSGSTILPVVSTSTTIISSNTEKKELQAVENTGESENSAEAILEVTPSTSIITAVSTTLPLVEIEEDISISIEVEEVDEIEVPVTSTTAVPTEISQANNLQAPLVGVALETIELRIGAEYRRKLATGGVKPYQTTLLEGTLPDGLNVDEEGEIFGNPSKSGIFEAIIEIKDTSNNNLRQPISFNVSEYRFISAIGGSVTVIITGESVRFFSALNASGYEPAVVLREGPLMVEVSFLPISDEELSWVRCAVVQSFVECEKN